MSRLSHIAAGMAIFCASLGFLPWASAAPPAVQRCAPDAGGEGLAGLIAELKSPGSGQPVPDLIQAIQARRLDTVSRLLKTRPKALVCHHGMSALSFAAFNGDDDAVRLLVRAMGHPDAVLDSDGKTALFSSLARGQWRTLDLLVRLGADPLHRADRGLNALHQLAMADQGTREGWADVQVKVAGALVASGLAVDAPGPQGYTALQLATVHRHTTLVAWLLNQGADPDHIDQRGGSAQAVAQRSGNAPMLSLFARARLLNLLREERLTEFAQKLDSCGGAAQPVSPSVATDLLMPSLRHRQPEITRALLACGANANLPGPAEMGGKPQQTTPLVYAAGELGSLPLVKLLLDAGADASAPAQRPGGTALVLPLDAARQAGHEDIVRLLAARMAQPAR